MRTSNNESPRAGIIEVKAARRQLKCDPRTIFRWILTGKLRAWKRAGRTYVALAELRALAGELPLAAEPPPARPTPPATPVFLPGGCLQPRPRR
jgi:hypothetical protein